MGARSDKDDADARARAKAGANGPASAAPAGGHGARDLPKSILRSGLIKPDIHKVKSIDDKGPFQLFTLGSPTALKPAGTRQFDKGVFVREQQVQPGVAVKKVVEFASVVPAPHTQVHLAQALVLALEHRWLILLNNLQKHNQF